MTKKQELFCQEYIKCKRNGLQAYLNVYNCTPESAKAEASRLLTNDNIKDYIDELCKEVKEENLIEVADIINGIAEIAFDKDARRSDKLKAFELLGKYKALFTDKKEIQVKEIPKYIINFPGEPTD